MNATALNVTWLPPKFSNGILKGYRVKFERTHDKSVVSSPDVVGNMTLSHVIVNLQEYTNYSITVQAFVFGPNEDLSGAFSSPVIALTNAEGLFFQCPYSCCMKFDWDCIILLLSS